MAETGRMACWMGFGKGFEIREYPVPDPEPGAVVIKVAIANVCGSDMHYWKGEQDYAKMGRPLPLNTGHEPNNTASRRGILKAGFRLAGHIWRSGSGEPVFDGDAADDPELARRAARTLGLPLIGPHSTGADAPTGFG